MVAQGPLDRDRGVDGRREPSSKAAKKPSPVVLTISPPPALDELPEHVVVPAQEPLPGLVAERLGKARRADDVGEHERLPCAVCGPAPAIRGRRAARARRPRRRPARRGGGTPRGPPRSSRSASSSSSTRPEGARQDRPGPGDLVRRADVAPALDRRSGARCAGAAASPSARRTRPTGDPAAGLERRRRIAR